MAAALASALMFGFGLSLSGMLDPARVRGFLDVTGSWDPSLSFVLGGAVATAALGQFVARRLGKPLFDDRFAWPDTGVIDAPLIAGSTLFGIGWGVSGLCPGPAIASLVLGLMPIAVFVSAMIAGMLLFRWLLGGPNLRGYDPLSAVQRSNAFIAVQNQVRSCRSLKCYRFSLNLCDGNHGINEEIANS